MSQFTGITKAYRKDGSLYYRASITCSGKHISLGSYTTPEEGARAYAEASALLAHPQPSVQDYKNTMALSFSKYVMLVNLRNNGIYIKTPIYLHKDYFLYYLKPDFALKFDKDDLFFYSSHTIQQKGGYLFICHYGSQYGILSRYGIHPFSVAGRDYIFVNGDNRDYRYENIKVLNHYMGVTEEQHQGKIIYTASIHIRGTYMIGRYSTEEDAAIAYNKAADILIKKGIQKQFIQNYISNLSSEEYASRYQSIQISKQLYSGII